MTYLMNINQHVIFIFLRYIDFYFMFYLIFFYQYIHLSFYSTLLYIAVLYSTVHYYSILFCLFLNVCILFQSKVNVVKWIYVDYRNLKENPSLVYWITQDQLLALTLSCLIGLFEDKNGGEQHTCCPEQLEGRPKEKCSKTYANIVQSTCQISMLIIK